MSSGRLRSWSLVGIGAIAGLSISYGLTAYAFRDTHGPIPLEEIREFTEVFGAIKANYVEPVEDRKLMQEAISGMLAGLDPHSAFLDADAFKDLQVGTQGEFGGLGIEVGAEDGAVRVIAPIDDTPAARAGIRAGDLIIKIDDKFTRGMALGDAIKLMRGKPKTPITLTLVRKGENAPLEVKLMRDVIRVQSVKSKVLEPGYAFVRITQFQERTVDDLAKQLADMYKQGPLKGIVLDLRNDPGGLLHAAVGVSAVFLPPDSTVVTTEGRTEDAHRRYAANPSDYQRTHGDDALAHLPAQVKSVPLVVLVNGASASASEIVAGALQDHKRAALIGTQTFGKGSVQTIIPIRNDRDNPTAIKLTTARYYTPSGRSIQAQGITPDMQVDDTPEGNFAGLNVREADLAHHLENQNAAALEAVKATEQQNATATDKEGATAPHPIAGPHRYEFGSAEDFQLKQAVNFLQGRPVDTVKPKEAVAASPAPAPGH